jgi:hypothetical protein
MIVFSQSHCPKEKGDGTTEVGGAYILAFIESGTNFESKFI